jgi:hypothetical protein
LVRNLKRVKLNGAICLEPLSNDEVDDYLASSGSKLAALREAVKTDSVLQELAQTPLMLSVMSLASQGTGGKELANQKGDSTEKRRHEIFRLYVEQMFQRKAVASLVFPKEKTIGWLSSLARKMREHSQSIFLLEGLQPNWLGTGAKRLVYETIVTLSLGFIAGLIFGLGQYLVWFGREGLVAGVIVGLSIFLGVGLGCRSESPLKNGLVSGSITGLMICLIRWPQLKSELEHYGEMLGGSTVLVSMLGKGLIVGLTGGAISGLGVGSLNHITLVETMGWKWNQCWKKAIPGLIFGLIAGLTFGLVGMPISLRSLLIDELGYSLRYGLILGLIGGLISGLVGGLSNRVKADKTYPNQGIHLSVRNSFATFLATSLILEPIFKLFPTMILTFGEMEGLIFGLIAGLNRGGSAVIKHYAVRLILWLKGYTPSNFIKFLDHCATLILLKKVGGGYIFIHRMLLDHFADLPAIERSGESKRA